MMFHRGVSTWGNARRRGNYPVEEIKKMKMKKSQIKGNMITTAWLAFLLMLHHNSGAGLYFNGSFLFFSQSILHHAYLAHSCLLDKPTPHQKIFLVQLSAKKLAPRPTFCPNILIHSIFCNPRQPLIRTWIWNKSSRKNVVEIISIYP